MTTSGGGPLPSLGLGMKIVFFHQGTFLQFIYSGTVDNLLAETIEERFVRYF